MDKLKKIKIIGIIFTSVVGSLLHFVYQWSGKNPVAGIFASVNESTWEHLKLAFWPMLIFTAVELLLTGHKNTALIPSRAAAIYTAFISIVVLFYTYTGIIGRNFLWADISIFIISVALGEFVALKILEKTKNRKVKDIVIIISAASLILLAVLFIVFTFNPPPINLFKSPV